MHHVCKKIIYRVYSKSEHCGSKLFDMHPEEDDMAALLFKAYEKMLLSKFESA